MDKSNPKFIEELRNIPGEFPINICFYSFAKTIQY